MPNPLNDALFVITARGGSKGVPGKNIKPLGGKPLLHYTIDVARQLTCDENICLSTDAIEIIRCANEYGLAVPFKRPGHLATDVAGTYEVLLHALDFYASLGRCYETLVLLQPTSPFRTAKHIVEAFELYSPLIDMVVSVTESTNNPYYNLFEENNNGYLHKIKDCDSQSRQLCPKVYNYNGAVYIINTHSLKQFPLSQFKRKVKYLMTELEYDD
jgi:N-acylneuraminate cytidylyltransferase